MLVLTGTTGHLGSRVLHCLLSQKLIPPSSLIISSSDSSKVPSIAREQGVEIHHGDFTSPESLQPSFRGAKVLFLISFPSPSIERWEHHRNAIEAAKAVGVDTVIYTSLMFGGETGMESVAGVQQAHIKTINYLVDSGLKYIILREGIYVESWWLYAGYQPQGGFEASGKTKDDINFVIPNDGPVAWVSWDDLAEGTAKILANYQKYVGQTLSLTGQESLTIAEIGKMVEEQIGRKVNVRVVGREAAAIYHKENKSLPENSFWVIDSWSGWHDGIAYGETAVVDPLLQELVGRRPRSMDEMAPDLFLRRL